MTEQLRKRGRPTKGAAAVAPEAALVVAAASAPAAAPVVETAPVAKTTAATGAVTVNPWAADLQRYRQKLDSRANFSDDEDDDSVQTQTDTIVGKIKHALRLKFSDSHVQVYGTATPAATTALPVKGERLYCPIAGCEKHFLNYEGLLYHGRTTIHEPRKFLNGIFPDDEVSERCRFAKTNGRCRNKKVEQALLVASTAAVLPVRRVLVVSLYAGTSRCVPFSIGTGSVLKKVKSAAPSVPKEPVVRVDDSAASAASSASTGDGQKTPRARKPIQRLHMVDSAALEDELQADVPAKKARDHDHADDWKAAGSESSSDLDDNADDDDDVSEEEDDDQGNAIIVAEDDEEVIEEPKFKRKRAASALSSSSPAKHARKAEHTPAVVSGVVFPNWLMKTDQVVETNVADFHSSDAADLTIKVAGHQRETWPLFCSEKASDNKGHTIRSSQIPRAVAWLNNVVGGSDILVIAGYSAAQRPLQKVGNRPAKSIVEFWSVPLQGTNEAPRLLLTWTHEYGIAWNVAWCPSGGPEPEPDKTRGELGRLGLLAITTSDGYVRVVAVPDPKDLPNREPDGRPRSLQLPVLWANSLEGHPWYSLDWSSANNASTLVVGSLTGVIGVFNMNAAHASNLSDPSMLIPFAIGQSVDSVFVNPSIPNLVIAGSALFHVSIWDLSDPSHPVWVHRVKDSVPSVRWTSTGDSFVFVDDRDVQVCKPNDTQALQSWHSSTVIQHRNFVWSFDVTDNLVYASAGADGRVLVEAVRNAKNKTPVHLRGAQLAQNLPLAPRSDVYVRLHGVDYDESTLSFPAGYNDSLPDVPLHLAFLKVAWNRDERAAYWLAMGSATGLVHIRRAPVTA